MTLENKKNYSLRRPERTFYEMMVARHEASEGFDPTKAFGFYPVGTGE